MFDVSLEGANLWFDISNVILLVGALLVALGTYGTIRFAGIKEKFSDERVSANEAETKRAIADSDIAKQGAAEANARAAEAKLALEQFKAPRLLTPQQQAAIAKSLLDFKGKRIAIAPSPATFESTSLAEQIVAALTLAGISAEPNPGAVRLHVGVAKGVVIRYTTGNEVAERLSKAVAKALNIQGVAAFPLDGLMEDIISKMPDGSARNIEGREWIVMAVGDKPG